ncbi:MAG TPA: hypothetical protein ENK31_05545 [Nannocystis exedens]|nr:hypothetical protein [Nannocystis exedens]
MQEWLYPTGLVPGDGGEYDDLRAANLGTGDRRPLLVPHHSSRSCTRRPPGIARPMSGQRLNGAPGRGPHFFASSAALPSVTALLPPSLPLHAQIPSPVVTTATNAHTYFLDLPAAAAIVAILPAYEHRRGSPPGLDADRSTGY